MMGNSQEDIISFCTDFARLINTDIRILLQLLETLLMIQKRLLDLGTKLQAEKKSDIDKSA